MINIPIGVLIEVVRSRLLPFRFQTALRSGRAGGTSALGVLCRTAGVADRATSRLRSGGPIRRNLSFPDPATSLTGSYKGDRWYSKGKWTGRRVPKRVRRGDGGTWLASWYHPVPPTS